MKISIVTPSLNQCRFLQRTLASILNQQGDFALESIVIDGGSTDGTIEYLQGIDDPRLVWVSESDRGQSNAINKALTRTSGEIVGWLNSDDLYVPDALRIVATAFEAHPQAQWLIGGCDIIDSDDRPIRPWITRYKNFSRRRYSHRKLLRENFISQPAVFWRSDFGRRVGGLDESLHWTMDYDLWLRMGRASSPLILPQTLSQFRIHDTSKSGQVDRRQFDEGYEVARRYGGRDALSLWLHQLNVEKIVLAYRLMKKLQTKA